MHPSTHIRTIASIFLMLFASGIQAAAQYRDQHKPPVSAFGVDDTSRIHHITYAQIFQHPRLDANFPEDSITGYTISMLPKGKDYRGPYRVVGSNKIQPEFLAYLRDLRDEGATNTRLCLEDVHLYVHSDHIVRTVPTMLFTVNP
jgi:hypothetical protein